jgi:hypothetical protein
MKNPGFLNWLSKSKMSDDQVATLFVNTMLESVEKSWPEVVTFLNDHPCFDRSPKLDPTDFGRFLMIVVAANMQLVPKHFDSGIDRRIIERICFRFSQILDLKPEFFIKKVKQYRAFMKQMNQPSKNSVRAMSRAVFYKYQLAQYQESYFRDMNVPNPKVQRELKDLMSHFIWDWEEFSDSYRVVESKQVAEAL